MKKFFLLLLLTGLTALSAGAQWRLGASAGASYNWYSIDKHYQSDFNYQGLWAPTGALTGQYDFNHWMGIRAEMEYLRKDHRFYRTQIYSGTDWKVFNTYLQIPVMAVFHYGGERLKGFTHLGGYGGYWLQCRREGTQYNPSSEETFEVHERYAFIEEKDRRFDAGLIAGTGLEYRFLRHWAVQLEGRLCFSQLSTVKQYMAIKDYRYNATTSLRLGIQYIF